MLVPMSSGEGVASAVGFSPGSAQPASSKTAINTAYLTAPPPPPPTSRSRSGCTSPPPAAPPSRTAPSRSRTCSGARGAAAPPAAAACCWCRSPVLPLRRLLRLPPAPLVSQPLPPAIAPLVYRCLRPLAQQRL